MTLRAVRADGVLFRHLPRNTKYVERITEWIANLSTPRWMAVEACPFVEWFIDRYTPCVDRTDIADPQLMQLRPFGRHWRQLSRPLAKAKRGMKSMLNAANNRGPQSDGPRTHRWLLTFGGLLQPAQRLAVGTSVDQILLIKRQQEILRRELLTALGRRLLRTLSATVRDGKPYWCGECGERNKTANEAKARRKACAVQQA